MGPSISPVNDKHQPKSFPWQGFSKMGEIAGSNPAGSILNQNVLKS